MLLIHWLREVYRGQLRVHAQRVRRSHSRRSDIAQIEFLEQRRLLTDITVTVAPTGVLTIADAGTAQTNSITVQYDNSAHLQLIGGAGTTFNGSASPFDATAFAGSTVLTKIIANTNDNNDTVVLDSTNAPLAFSGGINLNGGIGSHTFSFVTDTNAANSLGNVTVSDATGVNTLDFSGNGTTTELHLDLGKTVTQEALNKVNNAGHSLLNLTLTVSPNNTIIGGTGYNYLTDGATGFNTFDAHLGLSNTFYFVDPTSDHVDTIIPSATINNRLDFSRTSATTQVNADLSITTTDSTGTPLATVANSSPSATLKVITGAANQAQYFDSLTGGAGVDTLVGGAGGAYFYAGSGNTTLDGSKSTVFNNFFFSYPTSNAQDIVIPSANSFNSIFAGTTGSVLPPDSVVIDLSQVNSNVAATPLATLTSSAATLKVLTAASNQAQYFNDAQGNGTNVTLTAGANPNTVLTGFGKNNILTGSTGTQALHGYGTNNTLIAGDGNQTLDAGSSAATGNNVFVFHDPKQNSTVTITPSTVAGAKNTLDFSPTTAIVGAELGIASTDNAITPLAEITAVPHPFIATILTAAPNQAQYFQKVICGSGGDSIQGGANSLTFVAGTGFDQLDGSLGTGTNTFQFTDPSKNEISFVTPGANAIANVLDFSLTTTSDVSVDLTLSNTDYNNGTGVPLATVASPSGLPTNVLSIYTGAGNQAQYFSSVIGGKQNNTLNANSAPVNLPGTPPLILDGHLGTKTNTFYVGSAGNDVLDGGTGTNVYKFTDTIGLALDTIVPLAGSTNTLDFSGLLNTEATTPLMVNLTTVGGTNDPTDQLWLAKAAGRRVYVNAAADTKAFQTVIGSTGFNQLVAGAGPNVTLDVSSSTGTNRLTAGTGTDSLVGGSGTNTFAFVDPTSTTTDTVTPLPGTTNTLDFSAMMISDLTVDLSQTATTTLASATAKTLTVLTYAGAQNYFQTVIGAAGARTNTLIAGGPVTLDGSRSTGSNLFYVGAAGNDTLMGGAGNNTYYFSDTTGIALDTIVPVTAISNVLDFHNVLNTAANAPLQVNLTHRGFNEGSDTEWIAKAPGRRVYVNNPSATDAFTKVVSAPGYNQLVAGTGPNVVLDAGASTKTNTLTAGSGTDTLIGGTGNNTFVFLDPTAPVNDTVTPNSSGKNTLDFSELTQSNLRVDLSQAQPTNFATATAGSKILNVSTQAGALNYFQTVIGGNGNNTNLLTAGFSDVNLVGGSGTNTFFFVDPTKVANDSVTPVNGATNTLDFSQMTQSNLMVDLSQTGTTTLATATAGANILTITTPAGSQNAFQTVIGGAGHKTNTLIAGGPVLLDGSKSFGTNLFYTGSAGNDRLLGGLGANTYFFTDATGIALDTIVSAPFSTNTLDFSGMVNTTDSTPLQVDLTHTGENEAGDMQWLARATGRRVYLDPTSSPDQFQNVIGSKGFNQLTAGTGPTVTLDASLSTGTNTLTAGSGTNTLKGGSGTNTFIFLDPVGIVSGSAVFTSNTITVPTVTDTVAPKAGATNTLDFSRLTRSPLTIDLTQTSTTFLGFAQNFAKKLNLVTANAGDQNYFQKVIGGQAGDTLIAGQGGVTLYGGAGNDTLTGVAGDTIYGEGGSNSITVSGSSSLLNTLIYGDNVGDTHPGGQNTILIGDKSVVGANTPNQVFKGSVAIYTGDLKGPGGSQNPSDPSVTVYQSIEVNNANIAGALTISGAQAGTKDDNTASILLKASNFGSISTNLQNNSGNTLYTQELCTVAGDVMILLGDGKNDTYIAGLNNTVPRIGPYQNLINGMLTFTGGSGDDLLILDTVTVVGKVNLNGGGGQNTAGIQSSTLHGTTKYNPLDTVNVIITNFTPGQFSDYFKP